MNSSYFKPLIEFYFILLCLLALVSFTSPLPTNSKILTYDITLNGKKIGYLAVHRKEVDGRLYYSFSSQVDYRLIKHFDIRFTVESCYKEGKLIESSYNHKINGLLKSECQVNKEVNGYKIALDGTEHTLTVSSISYSLTALYFCEPEKINQVFSERYGKFLPVQKVEKDRYMITMPDGEKNYYLFWGGICQEVNAEVVFGKLQFKLQTS